MSGWGYHWTRCRGGGGGGGQAALYIVIAIVSVVVALWLLARIWWILGGVAVVGVLAVAGVLRLARWRDRKDAALWAAQRPAQLRAEPVRELPRERPAIPQVVNINIYGADVTRAAAVIRQALPGGGDDDAESR